MIECYERNAFCPEEVERYIDPDGRLSIQSVKLFAGEVSLDNDVKNVFLTPIRWSFRKLGKRADRPIY